MPQEQPKKRCDNCKSILINGTIISGVAQVACDRCGHKNIVVSDAIEMDRRRKMMGKAG